MAASCAIQLTPKNGVTEESAALETWPDAATEVIVEPSQVNTTSLVPPVKPPSGASMVKLLFIEPITAKACAATQTINNTAKNSILNFFIVLNLHQFSLETRVKITQNPDTIRKTFH